MRSNRHIYTPLALMAVVLSLTVTACDQRVPHNKNISARATSDDGAAATPDRRAWELAALTAYKNSSSSLLELKSEASKGDATAEYGLGMYFDFLSIQVVTSHKVNIAGTMLTPLLDAERDRLISSDFSDLSEEASSGMHAGILTAMRAAKIKTANLEKVRGDLQKAISFWKQSASNGDQAAAGALAAEYFAEILREVTGLAAVGWRPDSAWATTVERRSMLLEQGTVANACARMSDYFDEALKGPNPAMRAMMSASVWHGMDFSEGSVFKSWLGGTACDRHDEVEAEALIEKCADAENVDCAQGLFLRAVKQSDFAGKRKWAAKARSAWNYEARFDEPEGDLLAGCFDESVVTTDEFYGCAANTGRHDLELARSKSASQLDEAKNNARFACPVKRAGCKQTPKDVADGSGASGQRPETNDVMQPRFGNTVISRSDSAEWHLYFESGGRFTGREIRSSYDVSGTWEVRNGNLCLTFDPPMTGAGNPNCKPAARHHIGDTWTSAGSTMTLVQGVR